MRAESAPEALLALQLRAAGVAGWEREFRFAPPRRWRLDFAWPAVRVAVEIEGGIWRPGGGAHSRPANIERDAEKQKKKLAAKQEEADKALEDIQESMGKATVQKQVRAAPLADL